MSVVVIGQIARDLVLRTDGPPSTDYSVTVLQRNELLGGKGANQAVGLTQLGVPVALIGVVGDDHAGAAVLQQAQRDGIDIGGVARRGTTALLIDVVGRPAERMLMEDVPASSLVRVADLDRAASLLEADATEASLLAGREITTVERARELAEHLLACGPELAAIAVPGVGDLVAWRGGSEVFEFADVKVMDPTGAGDAFVAGLIAALRDGATPREAGRRASSAAGATVQHLGGRPDLTALRA